MSLNLKINKILKKFETGNKLDSYKELQKIFKKNKRNNLLRYNLAVVQQQLNLNEEARLNYNYLIKIESNIKAMINLYNIDIIEAKYKEALDTIIKILQIKEIDNVHKDKAFVFYKLNRIKESKEICIFYLKKNPKDLVSLNIIGQCLFHEGKYDESVKIFDKILEIDPSCNNDEVKKGYRKMANKYHPDKVSHLGIDLQHIAEEKFKAVNNAYQTIKKERKI